MHNFLEAQTTLEDYQKKTKDRLKKVLLALLFLYNIKIK